ncbi:MAG: hypothetical protein JW726_13395 [Anaerolineales bacterium]|nr:hypothetical protein [Anaerolineales bacterium]
MKTRRIVVQLLSSMIVMVSLVGVQAQQLAPAEAAALEAAHPVAELLHPDGSLALPPGYQGAIDPDGWRMDYDAQGAPLFMPAASANPPAPQGDWYALGNGLGDQVFAILAFGSDIYVGGDFQDAGGNTDADYIARWDGAAWHAVGGGLDGTVYDIENVGNILCIAGNFTSHVAILAGSTWNAVGGGVGSYVYDLEAVGGDLYVGGGFEDANTIGHADYLARWSFDDMAWHAVNGASAILDGPVYAIESVGGDLYVGGNFTAAGALTLNRIGRWNIASASWHAMGSGVGNRVYTLQSVGADLYVGGWFENAGGISQADYVAHWDGSAWHALGGTEDALNGIVARLLVIGPNLYAGGDFTQAGGDPKANYLARWDGSSWHAVTGGGGNGVNGTVLVMAALGANLYAGGEFTSADGDASNSHIARWDTTPALPFWDDLGTRFDPYDVVKTLVVLGEHLYIGGSFSDAGGNPQADNVAHWDGSAWQALGAGLDGSVIVMVAQGPYIYAGGDFDGGIARWDGSAWSQLGNGLGGDQKVRDIEVVGGDLYVGGDFENAGGDPNADNIARWDGSAWHAMGTGINGRVTTVETHGLLIYAGGYFEDNGGIDAADYIVYWDGLGWWPLSAVPLNDWVEHIQSDGQYIYASGWFTDVAGDPDADCYAIWYGGAWYPWIIGIGEETYISTFTVVGPDFYHSGLFGTSGPGGYIDHWDGTSWNGMGGGLNSSADQIVVVGPDVYVAGWFTQAGGNAQAMGIARYGRIQPRSILFDEAHDEENTIDWARAQLLNPEHPEWIYFGKLVEALGDEFTFTRNTSAELTLELLSGYDALMLASPRAAFSAAEQQAIQDYIATGGGVLALGNCDNDNSANELITGYGMTFHPRCLFGPIPDWNGDFEVTDFASHFALVGSDRYIPNWGQSLDLAPTGVYTTTELITTDDDIWEDTNRNDAYDLDDRTGPFTMAAATETGCGRLAAISDNDFQDDAFDYRDNGPLMRALLRWVTRGRECALQDTQAPTAAATCPAQSSSLSFGVSWSGTDDMSGIASYDVQYRVGTGSWADWPGLSAVTLTSSTFGPTTPVTVQRGETYAFRVRARDNAGNLGTYAPDGDCSTIILSDYQIFLPLAVRNP